MTMRAVTPASDAGPLANLGFYKVPRSHRNLCVAQLYEEALRRGEGVLAAEGPLVVHTGAHTGRSASDRYVVKHGASEKLVAWGNVNKPVTPDQFARLKQKVL